MVHVMVFLYGVIASIYTVDVYMCMCVYTCICCGTCILYVCMHVHVQVYCTAVHLCACAHAVAGNVFILQSIAYLFLRVICSTCTYEVTFRTMCVNMLHMYTCTKDLCIAYIMYVCTMYICMWIHVHVLEYMYMCW